MIFLLITLVLVAWPATALAKRRAAIAELRWTTIGWVALAFVAALVGVYAVITWLVVAIAPPYMAGALIYFGFVLFEFPIAAMLIVLLVLRAMPSPKSG